jgi:hypothetical protein
MTVTITGPCSALRTVGLGICPILRSLLPDLREVLLAGDRERPLVTGANGPLMGRRAVGVGAALDSSVTPQPVTVNSGYDPRHLAARQFNSFCSNWPVAVR